MTRSFAAFLLLASAPVLAQTLLDDEVLKTAAELREAALTDNTAYELIEGLTTEVGHRLAGSENDLRGRQWLKRHLETLGFDRVYEEVVSYPVWQRGDERCAVIAPFPQAIRCAALGGSMGTKGKELTATIKRYPDLASLRAAPADDAKGKVVFVDYQMSPKRDGAGYGPASEIRVTGASIAASKGAVAFLLRSAGTDVSARAPHTGVMRYANTPSLIPAAALGLTDADLLAAMLKRGEVRVALKLGARTIKGMYQGGNVIGEVTGREAPNEVVVIGGHLDSWDLGTGALDDGAGIAITAAAASLIGKLEVPPRKTIRFIGWANEEQGIYGGKAYAEARKLDSTLEKHSLASESDFGAGRVYAFHTRVGPSALAVVDQIMQVLAPLDIRRGNNAASGGPDAGPLRELGVPVFTLAQDGMNYFDVHHTENDTLDKIDPEALRQNVAAWVVVSYLAAEWSESFR
jgi:Zn-dependent M28 family amino/carboxypeptidase